LSAALASRDAAAAARARIGLAVVSVLLDAGAGASWSYFEPETGIRFTRSEGLGVATFRAFMAGAFSADSRDPLRVDAPALARIDADRLGRIFQDDAHNALVGLQGRVELLRRLAQALERERRVFGDEARPGGLFDAMTHASRGTPVVSADSLLSTLLAGLNGIWPSGTSLCGVPLGDCWPHPLAGGEGPAAGWVPFNKLSQWLAYSLFEPLEWAGMRVDGQDALTALPEYRNGGLLIDTGVVVPREPVPADAVLDAASEFVVEWRALTVALIDELAVRVRARLRLPDLPLACVLEGGTWAAGRELAMERRNGAPPFAIRSDGTIF